MSEWWACQLDIIDRSNSQTHVYMCHYLGGQEAQPHVS